MGFRNCGVIVPAVSLLVFAAFFSAPAAETASDRGAGEVSRLLLGVYNPYSPSEPPEEPAETDIHLFLDKPANYLGFAIDYADVNEPLPDFSRYYGIIVWLKNYEFREPERLLPWMLAAMRSGVKLILPDGLQTPNPPDGAPVHQELVAELLAGFGLEAMGRYLDDGGDVLRVNPLKPEFASHETELFSGQPSYPVYRMADGSKGEVWQRIERENDPDEHTVTVAVGEAGGWAQNSRVMYFSSDVPGTIFRVAWDISPIDFLERALDCGDMPRPDVTTFWGSRGAFSHVDVDGPYNMTQSDVPGPSRFAMEAVLEEVWRKYPYPTTLGLIAAEYDPDLEMRFLSAGETPEQALARPVRDWERPQSEVAAELRRLVGLTGELPWIQYGCHAYTHPLDWRNLAPSYAIRGYEPSYEAETRGAVEYLNREVLPPGREVELYQWSGDCDPPAEALGILDRMGMPNMNSGDPLYDDRHDSIYYVCPLSITRGKYRQIYTAGSNENIYTEEWRGFKGAYNHVVTTFERTDSPRRLMPVNIYYHVFPAESLAGLRAIQRACEWAARRDLCWLTAVEYVRAAESFFAVRLGRLDGGGWWAEDYGECATLRFDREDRAVDTAESRGVIGYSRHNGSLYVSLAPGKRAEVRLTSAPPDEPCLARASGALRGVERGADFWAAEARLWGTGGFVEIWAPPGEWRFDAAYPGGETVSGGAARLEDGRLRCEVPGADGKWVKVRFEK